jgi:hypothetical protein
MIPRLFYPHHADGLIRLGNKFDGGYVVTKKIIKQCSQCVSFGLGDDLTFEIDLQKKNYNIEFFVYDHTINNFFWIKHFFYWLWKSLRFRKYIKFLLFINYYLFFKIKKNNHYKKKVGSKKNSLIEIVKRNNIIPSKTILKIDIDGDEYKLLNQIGNFGFLCVIIEFDKFYLQLKKITSFVKKNKNLKIIHIHGNNFSQTTNNIPKSCEITFADKKYINKNNNKKKYPIKYLDYPNNSMKKDIELIFF